MAEGRSRLTTKELVIMALLSCMLLVGQIGMAFLPNIEVVSFLVYIYTRIYRKKVFLIIYVFVLLEGCVYGFGIWWMSYLYLWSILAAVVLLMRKWEDSVMLAVVVLGVYGLSFGALCSIPYFISGGVAAGFSYWVAGIPFDLLHCGGNIAVTLVLYKPVKGLLERLVSEANA